MPVEIRRIPLFQVLGQASYLKWFALGAVLAQLLVACVNWLVDPFAIHSSPRIAGFNALKPGILRHERIFKTVLAADAGWDAIILGTSRADIGLDPDHPAFAGLRCFNAATANQTHEETRQMLEAASASGKLRRAVIALDFFASNPRHAEIADYELANFSRWRRLEVVFSGTTLAESISTVIHQNRQLVERDYGIWERNGRREFSVRAGYRAAALGSDESYIRSHYQYPYTFSYRGSEPLAHVRRLIAYAHAKGIDLKLLISPSHARQWETLAVDGLWDDWEEWKRRLVLMNEEEARKAGRAPFALWDFSGYNTITVERFPAADDAAASMKWYWESSHYKKEAGDLALDRVFSVADPARRVPEDFGVRLTAATIDDHLRNIRAGRAAWLRAHPEDAAEIRRISAEYANKSSAGLESPLIGRNGP
jgi:hypothetical protein